MIKDQKSMDLLLLLLALHSSAAAFQAVGYELQGKIIHSAEFFTFIKVCQCFVSTNGIVYL